MDQIIKLIQLKLNDKIKERKSVTKFIDFKQANFEKWMELVSEVNHTKMFRQLNMEVAWNFFKPKYAKTTGNLSHK